MGLGPSCYSQWTKGNKETCKFAGYPAQVIDVTDIKNFAMVDDNKIEMQGKFLGTALFEFSTLVGKSKYKCEFFDVGKRDLTNISNTKDVKDVTPTEESKDGYSLLAQESKDANIYNNLKDISKTKSTNVAILLTAINTGADALADDLNPKLLESFQCMDVNIIDSATPELELTFRSVLVGKNCQSLVINGIGVGPKPEYICGQVRGNMDVTLKDTISSIRRDLLMAGLVDLYSQLRFS
jgi:hypothetical protein